MKNNRIVRAYDSINPSPVDKQRMLDAILAEANLSEEPRRQPRPRKQEPPVKKQAPNVCRMKPTPKPRRGSWIGPLAACLLVGIMGWFVLSFVASREPVDPAYVEPTTEKINITVNFDYSDVLSKYRTALREEWSKEQCEIEGISTRFYLPEPVDFTIGQRMHDINGDGRAELLIGHDDIIWDLYTTLEDGTPIQLFSDVQDGWQYYLCEGQMLLAEYYSKDDCYVEYYHLEGHQLVLHQQLQYKDGQWQYQLAGEDWQPMSEQDVQTLTNSYKYIQPDWIPLENENTADSFRDIIFRYMRAADEGWDSAMCLENGMSELTPVGPDEGLYYAMFDLNGDGAEELIISEQPYRENTDTEFIDIYAMVDGAVRNVMSVKEEDMWSLCVHGYIKDISPAQRPEWNQYASYWQFQENHFVQQFAVGKKDNQWINEGYHGVGETITREEADEIVANYPPQKLDFKIIQSAPSYLHNTGYEGFDHILDKYSYALAEKWTAEQCQQNDISPDILSETTITHNLGWCLVDIDNNGVEELIVSDGVHLFDLYVMMPHNGSPGHLISANGGDAWSLRENGVILQQGWYSGASAWRFYTLSDIDLIQKDMLFYEGETNQYSYGADDDSLTPISKDKAGQIMARDKNAELELEYFIPQTFDPDEVLQYQNLLELYQKALRENWDAPTCIENDLSLMVAYEGDYYGELGYAMQDLDGNGIEELIITDGLNIYDLYTIIQDEEVIPLHLASAMERIQYYLTTDGWIYNLGSGGAAVSYHTLYSLEGRELKLLEGYMMDADTDPNNPWFYYDGQNRLGACPTAEAAAAMDSYVFAEIPFTPFQ